MGGELRNIVPSHSTAQGGLETDTALPGVRTHPDMGAPPHGSGNTETHVPGSPGPAGRVSGGSDTLSRSGKPTASLCSILSESFLHLLLSLLVKCMQIKHGW